MKLQYVDAEWGMYYHTMELDLLKKVAILCLTGYMNTWFLPKLAPKVQLPKSVKLANPATYSYSRLTTVPSGKPQKCRNNKYSQNFNVYRLQKLHFKVNIFQGATEPSKKPTDTKFPEIPQTSKYQNGLSCVINTRK